MAQRDYAGNATPSALDSGITNVALSFDIPPADATSWPTGGANGKFVVTIDRGLPSEERILVTSQSGGSCTIASLPDRGLDGTVAVAHSAGAACEHTYSAFDAKEANTHINNTALDEHTQYMLASGTRHDLTARHSAGSVVPTAVPLAVGTSLAEGAGTTLARSSHVHTVGVGAINAANMFATGIVDLAAIGANAVGTSELVDNAVTTAKILDGAITSAKILDGTITLADLAAALQAFLVPTGTCAWWPTGTAPTGWQLGDGAAISRTTFSALFALIGTTFGAGDGSTTFNKPNAKQRFILGKADSGTGNAIAAVGGDIDHTHNLNTSTAIAQVEGIASGAESPYWKRKASTGWTADIFTSGGGAAGATSQAFNSGAGLQGLTATSNPPYLVLNLIIKT